MKYDYLIVGAGLFGATFAHEMTKKGKKCLVIDRRKHIGGNVYCENINGIDVHKYGAHIFHTSNKKIWDYVTNLTEFNDFINSPMANYNGELYHLPFNMYTFTELWPDIKTPEEAKAQIATEKLNLKGREPKNLEEQALSLVGHTIYKKLIKGYTEKQWGRSCKKLPASIIRRIPVRFTFDNNYFNDTYQGIPIHGYNDLIEKLLEGSDIELGVDFLKNREKYTAKAKKILYTGMIDEYYDYRFGNLEYRSLRFKQEIISEIDDYQGNAVVNYTDRTTPYTRIIEHKHFTSNDCEGTIITKEYPSSWKPGREAYYPINDKKNIELYHKYQSLAEKEPNVLFGGRLGNYEYNDMDTTIEKALALAEKELSSEKSTKKRSPLTILSRIFFGIYLISAAATLINIYSTNILPGKYFLIGTGALLFLAIIFGIFSIPKKIKKIPKIISIVLEIILSALLIYSFFAFSEVQNFFSGIQASEYQIENFYVLINSDSDINNLSSLKTTAIYKDTSDTYKQALSDFAKKSEATTTEYSDFIDAGTALIENKTDSLLLRGTLKDTVSEIIPSFDKKTKILSTIEIKVKKESAEVPDIDVSTEPFNIYISGIDTYGDISVVSRSDVNMIATVNPKNNQILLTSIPRDYYVQLHGTEGLRDKLTHAGIYGIDMSRTTLEDIFGIDINYYIRVNFSTLIDIVDTIDGIKITPDTTFTAWTNHSCTFYANETMDLGGECALAYARERYSYAEGDRHRVQNQQDVLNAIIHKISTNKSLILKYSELLGSIGNSIETNIPNSQIYKLINKQLDTMPSWTISKNQVDGFGSMDYTYSMPSQPLYVMIPDDATVEEAIIKINEVLSK